MRSPRHLTAAFNGLCAHLSLRRARSTLQAISFGAADMDPGSLVTVDVDLVRERVGDMLVRSDLSKFII